MWPSPRGLLFVLVMLMLQVVPASAEEVLTNDAIVTMTNAGLSDGVILARIRSSQTRFDVSTPALIKLKQAGVSDQVIEAMVGRASSPGGPAPTTAAPVPGAKGGARQPPAVREGVFHLSGDRYVELTPALSSVETNYAFFNVKSEMVLKGRKAHYRMTERTPVFFSSMVPTEMPLVRLKPGDDHDDRNLKVSTGGFMPFGGTLKFGIRTQDMIDVAWEKDPAGFYRITPRKPLPPGEYGFIHTVGLAAHAAGRVYDFGVD